MSNALTKTTNVITIGSSAIVGYQAYKALRVGIKNKQTAEIVAGVAMIFVAYAAIRWSLQRLNE